MISYMKMLSVVTEHTIIGSKGEGEYQDGTSSLGSVRAALEAPRFVLNRNLAPQTKLQDQPSGLLRREAGGRGSLSLLSVQYPEVAAGQAPSLRLLQFHGTKERSSHRSP